MMAAQSINFKRSAGWAVIGVSMVMCVQAQDELSHPILPIPGSGSNADAILSSWTESQYISNFVPRQAPRMTDLFAPFVVSGDTEWSWSVDAPHQMTSLPSGTIFPSASYPVYTQSVSVLSGETVDVPYYKSAANSSDKSFVSAGIDYYKVEKLRDDLEQLAPAYINSGGTPAMRNDAYARRIAVSLLEWSKTFPDYFMTQGWNKHVLINASTDYIFDGDHHRASWKNGTTREWLHAEVLAFDAIYDSVALVDLSAELGFDVRQYIENNMFFFTGNMFMDRMPVDVAIKSNLTSQYAIMAKVARILDRPDYITWLDQFLDATVAKKLNRDGVLSEGVGYSHGYALGVEDCAVSTQDYFLSRLADTPELVAISNRTSGYVSTLLRSEQQWRDIALPNGTLPSIGDTTFNTYFTARNAGSSALIPAYGTLSLGAGSDMNTIQLNQNFSGDNNHMRSDTTAFTLWALGGESLGNVRYYHCPGRAFGEQILAYNAVTIDRVDMSSPSADTYGNGDLTLYESGNNGLAMTEIDGQRAYENKASRYQRILLLNTHDIEAPYVVDVMRVSGGTTHDYIFHGSIMYDQTWESSADLVPSLADHPLLEGNEVWKKPTSDFGVFPYYGMWERVSSGQVSDEFQITYRDTSTQGRDMRLWMTGGETAYEVHVGETPVASRTRTTPEDWWSNDLWRPSTIIRKRISSGELESLFVSVIEPMSKGESKILHVERLPMVGDSLESCAVRITFTDGRVDTCVVNLRNPTVIGANTGSDTVTTEDGDYTLTGRVGLASEGPDGSRVWTVNARDFQYDGKTLAASDRYYSGPIVGETRTQAGGLNDALITTTPLPVGTALRGAQLSLNLGVLAGHGVDTISEMFEIDQVQLISGQYHICFANDHGLEMSNGMITAEQFTPFRTFTGNTTFEIALSASALPISSLADQYIPQGGGCSIPFSFEGLNGGDGADLEVLVSSSDSQLVPASGLVIEGSGTYRILTVAPASGQSGVAVVTVSVTDGVWINSRSFVLNVVQGLVPPDAPFGVSAFLGDSRVELSWAPSDKTTVYTVKRAEVSGGPYVALVSTAEPFYMDDTVVSGATYYYVITAVNGSGESANSVEVGAELRLPPNVEITLLSDDLSSLNNFNSVTISTSSWVSDGTDAVYTGAGGPARARMVSNTAFDFNPGGTDYETVVLEFTTHNADATVDRLEIGLVDTLTVSGYNNPLSALANVYGVMVNHTSNPNPAGLSFNYSTGTAPGTSVVDISVTPLAGTHTYKLIFTSTGTELFRDGVSQGATDKVLSFSRDYHIVAYGQGYDKRLKTLNNVTLTGARSLVPPDELVVSPGVAQSELNWSSSLGAVSYNVKRATAIGGPYITIGDTTALLYSDESAIPGTTYYYLVTAVNESGESLGSSRVSVTAYRPANALLLDDLSSPNHFGSETISISSWIFDGTNAIYSGAGGSARARLVSDAVFDFNPEGIAYETVVLEFTTHNADAALDRLEVGLIDVLTVPEYDNPLALTDDVYGVMVNHTSNPNPPGLYFNYSTGTEPGATAVDISATPLAGTHTYRMVFKSSGTELFQDGISQGTTAKTLDFTRDYRVVAYGQGYDSRLKTLNNVLLYSVRDEGYMDGLVDDVLWTYAFGSSSLVVSTDYMRKGFTYLMSGSTNLVSDPWVPIATFTSQEGSVTDTQQTGQSPSGFYKTELLGTP